MIFKKKNSKEVFKCQRCKSVVGAKHNFCPECGLRLASIEDEQKEFGMLGKYDLDEQEMQNQHGMMPDMGITDKIIGSLVNSLMKNLDRQFKEIEKGEVTTMPNGIKIKIGVPQKKKAAPAPKTISEAQLKKMVGLPRTIAKTSVRRLSDKVIYELATPGLSSPQDVIVSKLESGYEVKAIADKKVYVNSLPINLPIRNLSLADDKLFIEFKIQEE